MALEGESAALQHCLSRPFRSVATAASGRLRSSSPIRFGCERFQSAAEAEICSIRAVDRVTFTLAVGVDHPHLECASFARVASCLHPEVHGRPPDGCTTPEKKPRCVATAGPCS